MFAVSVAKLLLLASILSGACSFARSFPAGTLADALLRCAADASFTVWLLAHLRLEQALAVVAAVDLAAALLVVATLMGRRDAQRGLLVKRPAVLPGSTLTAALERALQHTFAHYDGGQGEPHEL